MGARQKLDAKARRRAERGPSFDEQNAPRLAAKLTKEKLIEYLLAREKVIARQWREIQRLQEELGTACTRAEQYAQIDRALNQLARLRVERDRRTPRSEVNGVLFESEGVRLPGADLSQLTRGELPTLTQPRALAAELARLEDAAAEMALSDEDRRAQEAEVDALNEEIAGLWEYAKLDEDTWRAIRHRWVHGG